MPLIEAQADAAILVQRYNSAWSELTNRVGFRQQIQQGYIVVGMAILGVFFGSNDAMRVRVAPFLLLAISIVTMFSCLTIHFHNLAIQRLALLLAKTEANLSILRCYSGLYYFWDGESSVAPQHATLRSWSRWSTLILFGSFISGGHILYYTLLAESDRNGNLMWPTGFVSFVSLLLLFWGLRGDRKSFKEEKILPSPTKADAGTGCPILTDHGSPQLDETNHNVADKAEQPVDEQLNRNDRNG